MADWIGEHYFYMRPDGSDAFPHLKITNRVTRFSDGLAWITTEKHKGYINRDGKWVIGGTSAVPLPEDGRNFQPFSEGLARYRGDKHSGFIDTKGKVAIPPEKFYRVEDFSGGFAAVNDSIEFGNQTWQYIDRTGKIVIPGQWSKARPFQHGVAWVAIDPNKGSIYNGRYRLIDSTGKNVLGDSAFTSSQTDARFVGGLCRIDGQVFRPDGSVVFTEAKDYFLHSFSEDSSLAMASIRGGGGFRIVHLPSKSVYGPVIPGFPNHPFTEGLVTVTGTSEDRNRKFCYTRAGKLAFDIGFFDTPQFENGFAVVRRYYGTEVSDIRIVVINRKGEIVWKGEARS